MPIEKQVDTSHYAFTKYVSKPRWSSYYEQIRNILGLPGVDSCLEVGSGDQIVASVLKKYITYKTLDLDKDLSPDYYGSLVENDIDTTFDCVCAFQVLEHIPFSEFENNIQAMYNLSSKYVIISLPYTGLSFNITFRPFFKKPLVFKIPHYCNQRYAFDGEHYWDLGYKGTRLKHVKAILANYFVIHTSYINPSNMYHYFFVLEKR